jgi:hydroxymethylbilane synthase
MLSAGFLGLIPPYRKNLKKIKKIGNRITVKRKNNKIVIATRGSKLALWQANWVKTELETKNPEIRVELKKIKTTGDKILDVPLAKIGGKGLFLKEIEETLLRNEADLAVHSMKDVPVDLPEGLHLTAICERENPRDALIAKNPDQGKRSIKGFKDLPKGALIGTSSLRRTCQILHVRPDLKITQLRGNLDTRIRKLKEGQFDAIIVAVAGVKRLGMSESITEVIGSDISLPAIGQGAIGIECRIDDKPVNDLLTFFNHRETSICIRAERAFLKRLEGGCQVPIAAYARLLPEDKELRSSEDKMSTSQTLSVSTSQLRDVKLVLDGLVGSISGDRLIKGSLNGMPDNAETLGTQLADDLLSRGAREILIEVYKDTKGFSFSEDSFQP